MGLTVFIARLSILLILFMFFSAGNTVRAEGEFSEYEVKAGFIYNFVKFVEWPDGPPTDTKILTLCILGVDPFGKNADSIIDKIVRGKKLSVKRLEEQGEFKGCSIVFISGSEKGNLAHILEILKGKNILTISDTKGFGKQGVMINFFMEENKVRFEINLEKARQANLTISSKLLRLARIIE